jgi:hypothetical protein
MSGLDVQALLEADQHRHYPLTINALDLIDKQEGLASALLANPVRMLPMCNRTVQAAMAELLATHSQRFGMLHKPNVHARLSNLPICPELRRPTLPRTEDVGRFLAISGTVIRACLSLLVCISVHLCASLCISGTVIRACLTCLSLLVCLSGTAIRACLTCLSLLVCLSGTAIRACLSLLVWWGPSPAPPFEPNARVFPLFPSTHPSICIFLNACPHLPASGRVRGSCEYGY